MDGESAKPGVGAIDAASTPPVLGLTPIHLVKYQQRFEDKYSQREVKRGRSITQDSINIALAVDPWRMARS